MALRLIATSAGLVTVVMNVAGRPVSLVARRSEDEHAFDSVSVMHSESLDHLSARHAVFVTTAMHMQHPRTDYQRWRRDWAEINRLVEEINRLAALQPRPK